MRYLLRLAFRISAAVLLAGCGGTQPPIDPPVTMQQAPSPGSAGQPALAQRFAPEPLRFSTFQTTAMVAELCSILIIQRASRRSDRSALTPGAFARKERGRSGPRARMRSQSSRSAAQPHQSAQNDFLHFRMRR